MFITCPRFWLHVPLGIFNGVLFAFNIHAAWAILITFFVYELWQCFRIQDGSHEDIIGHLGGLTIGSVVLLWIV